MKLTNFIKNLLIVILKPSNKKILLACIVAFIIGLFITKGHLPGTFTIVLVAWLLFWGDKMNNSKKTKKKYSFLSWESDFTNYLIQLIAAVIREDKKETDSELRYIETALLQHFTMKRTQKLMKQIRLNLDKKEIPIVHICKLIRANFNVSSKLQLMHLLIGIAAADGLLTKKEEQLLKNIAAEIRLPYATFKQILSMFRFRYEGQQQKKKKKTYTSLHRLKNAYSVLGLTADATEKEIKKAYRKLAVIHHPDKVAHLGPEIQAAANDKFLVISEAYELIKKKKGFA